MNIITYNECTCGDYQEGCVVCSNRELIKENQMLKNAYNILNREHSMMLKELKLSIEIKPTKEIIRKAITSLTNKEKKE